MNKTENMIFIINYKKPQAIVLAKESAAYLAGKVNVLHPEDAPGYSVEQIKEVLPVLTNKKPGFALVFGGDGTILHSARLMSPYNIPIVGVNFGTLGFLAAIEPQELIPALDKILAGDFFVEGRMQLQCIIERDGRVVKSTLALNDFVLKHKDFSRAISLDLLINDQLACSYRADGIIIATPTGSTAYSLSANGPIVSPEMDLILVSPICAHLSHVPSLVVPPSKYLTVKFCSPYRAALVTADGQDSFDFQEGDKLTIFAADVRAKFIWPGQPNYFVSLRKKLFNGQL